MSHNSSHRFDQPLRVELRPSRLLLRAGALIYALAAIACCTLPWHWVGRACLLSLLGLHFALLYRRHVTASLPEAICALDWNARRGWSLLGPAGIWEQVTLATPVFVSHHLAVARFRGGRRCNRDVVVVGDRLNAGDFRRLRVRLIQSAHGDRNRKEISGQE